MLKNYRADIDGLRGLAILFVVIYHFFPGYLSGGFIGVDIFFVISGYLITLIISSDLQENKFSFYEFYARRIRRIFPPLLLVLFVVYVLGWFSLFAIEYQQLGKHIFSGAFFFSNITLLKESGYFDTTSELKPLLHLWSLAIEEQFYVVWPLLLALAYKTLVKNMRLVALLGGVSFLVSIYLIYTNPVMAFYFPISRCWELLVGSFLAFIVSNKKINLIQIKANYFSLLGFLLILFAAFYLRKELQFPGWWVCVPVLGSALIILGKDSWINQKILANKLLVAFGLISYSLYLWHWPLLSFFKIWYGRNLDWSTSFLVLAMSVLLAVLSYLIIERPARNQKNKLVFIMVLVMFFIGGAGFSVASRGGLEFRHQNIIKGYGGKAPHSDSVCLEKFIKFNPEFCNLSISNRSVATVILGDSIAHNTYPGLAKKYLETDQNIAMIGWPGTPPWVHSGHDPGAAKNKVNILLEGVAKDRTIQRVILSMSQPENINDILLQRIEETVLLLKRNDKKVLYVFSPPHVSFEPIQCIGMPPLRPKVKSDCSMSVAEISPSYFETKHRLQKLFDRLGVTSYDPFGAICSGKSCSIMVNGELLYRTNGYLSLRGSEFVFSKFSLDW